MLLRYIEYETKLEDLRKHRRKALAETGGTGLKTQGYALAIALALALALALAIALASAPHQCGGTPNQNSSSLSK
jgi:hypothetical protein